MLPTRDDVARLAGVSSATVSYVVNNGPRPVAEQTRLRVLQAIEQLGYQPSEVARSLKTKSTASIGLIISNIELNFFTRVARSVQDAAAALGSTVILANSDEHPQREADYLRLMSSKRVDGLIIAPTGQNIDLLRSLPDRGIPVVTIDRPAPGSTVPFVGIDNRRAAREAVVYLIAQGHRRIGMVAGLPNLAPIAERSAGFRDALTAAGLPVEEERIAVVESRELVQYRQASLATIDLLRCNPDITALFATNADLNMGVLFALHQLGMRVPVEISIVGFDDLEWFEVGPVPLTVVRQPAYRIGATAVDILGRIIAGESPPPAPVLLDTELIVRDSVSPPLR
jgi:DNA-binding LacI/PurR family transcriptional regulator